MLGCRLADSSFVDHYQWPKNFLLHCSRGLGKSRSCRRSSWQCLDWHCYPIWQFISWRLHIYVCHSDRSFQLGNWTAAAVEELLEPVQVHIDAANVLRDRCNEAYKTINREWGIDAAACVGMKGNFKRTLKLITSIARRTDVPDYETALLLINTQAVRRLVECKNRFSHHTY